MGGSLLAVAFRALPLLAEFKWDPQVRGIVIVITIFMALIGSTYVIIATNVGARLGFLLAMAGLTGWVMILSTLWFLNGQGLKGRDPSWKPVEIFAGPAARSPETKLDGLNTVTTPTGTGAALSGKWRTLATSEPVFGDAKAAADKLFAPDTTPPKEGQKAKVPPFAAPYTNTAQYKEVSAFERGGKFSDIWFQIKRHRFHQAGTAWNPLNWFRSPAHYVVITVQKVAPAAPGATATDPVSVDLSQTPQTLVLVRDRGSIRFPPLMIFLSSGSIFALSCVTLHRRDKAIMAARARGGAVPAAA